jgi:hypothetical protein
MLNVWQRNCVKLAEWFPLWIRLGCLSAWWQPGRGYGSSLTFCDDAIADPMAGGRLLAG